MAHYAELHIMGLGILTGLLMAGSFAFQAGAHFGASHWCPSQSNRYAVACDGQGRCYRLDLESGEVQEIGPEERRP
jgi:hypothetical protein